MFLSLVRLSLLASLCATVFASAIDPVARRQITRDRIVQRAATKAVLREFSANNPTRARRQAPGVSVIPAPPCNANLNLLPGYAHYANWDMPGRSTQPRPAAPVDASYPATSSERACQAACNSYLGGAGQTCIGLFWWPVQDIGNGNKFCSLKNSAYAPVTPADFSGDNQYAVSQGAALDMRGTCTYWRQFTMDAVCCET